MRFRFLQTGDLHIGRGRVRFGEQLSLERAGRLFDLLFQTAAEQKCHAVLITGDVFDTKAVTNREREVVTRKLTQYAGRDGIPTYVIPGNHDLLKANAGNLDYLAEVSASGEIPNLHVSFSSREAVWDAPAPGLSIIGAPVSLSEDQRWIDSFVTTLDKNHSYVFMGHATIGGCVRNDDGWKPSADEDAKRLSLATASRLAPQIVWWAYGDIHKRQELPTLSDGANGWYAGSPIQMDFGERLDRGVLIVALDLKDKTWRYTGRRYVRIDIPGCGVAPLVRVTRADQLNDLPEGALLQLQKSVVLPAALKEQVVSSYKLVDDRSTSEVAQGQDQPARTSDGQLELFDPLLADLATVEQSVLADLQTDQKMEAEAKKIVSLAVSRFRERTYVS